MTWRPRETWANASRRRRLAATQQHDVANLMTSHRPSDFKNAKRRRHVTDVRYRNRAATQPARVGEMKRDRHLIDLTNRQILINQARRIDEAPINGNNGLLAPSTIT